MEIPTTLEGTIGYLAAIAGLACAAWLYARLRRGTVGDATAREPLRGAATAPSTNSIPYPKLDPKHARHLVDAPTLRQPRASGPVAEQNPSDQSYRERMHARTTWFGARKPATGEPLHWNSTSRGRDPLQSGGKAISGTIYLQHDGRGLVKIGKTVGSSRGRMTSYARSHGLVGNWEIVREWKNVENFSHVERSIHVKLLEYRITHSMREVYVLSPEEAIREIEKVLSNFARA
jgi:hypothetical protein